MATYQSVADIARKLQSEFGEANVELHGETVVTQFDDFGIVITDLPARHKFLLYTAIGDLPATAADEHALLKRLMRANTFYAKTSGFTLSANDAFGVLLQGRIDHADLVEEEDLLTLIRNFVNVAAYWKERCDLHSLADADKPEDDPFEQLLMTALRV